MAWREAEAATTHASVYMGDKGKGKQHYSHFNATHVPDIIKTAGDEGEAKPEIAEIKNYTPHIHARTGHQGAVLNGDTYSFGNTEEKLKHIVLGARGRGWPTGEGYCRRTGQGYFPPHKGDYRDALDNRKARVRLLVHSSVTGGLSPRTASRLRRLYHLAKQGGDTDMTNYEDQPHYMNMFITYFSYRMATASVMNAAKGIHQVIGKKLKALTAGATLVGRMAAHGRA